MQCPVPHRTCRALTFWSDSVEGDRRGPAHRRAFPLCRIADGRLRRLGLLIDHAFRDLSEGQVGLLLFIERLLEKTDSVV
jgi:hypothetical protein